MILAEMRILNERSVGSASSREAAEKILIDKGEELKSIGFKVGKEGVQFEARDSDRYPGGKASLKVYPGDEMVSVGIGVELEGVGGIFWLTQSWND